MLERVSALGTAHERAVLDAYRAPGDVVTIARPRYDEAGERAALERVHAVTLAALASDADVVYQAAFFDGRFTGWADFLVREGDRWAVLDTKLARSAKVTALLQLAAYADQLVTAGVPVTRRRAPDPRRPARGRATASADLLPLYRERRARLEDLLDEHRAARRAGDLGRRPLPGVRSVRHVRRAGRRAPRRPAGRRDALDAARAAGGGGHRTRSTQLAAGTEAVPGIGVATLAEPAPAGGAPGRGRRRRRTPLVFEVVDPAAHRRPAGAGRRRHLLRLRGRPALDRRHGPADGPRTGGWSTCSGWSRPDGTFRPFWAHDRAQEKQAFVDFLDYVDRAPRRAPGHARLPLRAVRAVGAAAARGPARRRRGRASTSCCATASSSTCTRPCAAACAWAAARTRSRSSSRSTWATQTRGGEVTTADDSIIEYAEACDLRDAGDETAWQAQLRRDRRVQPVRLRVHAAAARLAAGARSGADGVRGAPRSRRARRGGPAGRSGSSRRRTVLRRPRGTGRRSGCSRRPSATTGGRRSRSGGRTSTGCSPTRPSGWTRAARCSSTGRPRWSRTGASARDVRPTAAVLRVAGHLEPGSDLRAGGKAYALYDAAARVREDVEHRAPRMDAERRDPRA